LTTRNIVSILETSSADFSEKNTIAYQMENSFYARGLTMSDSHSETKKAIEDALQTCQDFEKFLEKRRQQQKNAGKAES
jgi:hypothetical protein